MMTEEERLKGLLVDVANQLDKWAIESQSGGWSSHQVKPMIRLARMIRSRVGEFTSGRGFWSNIFDEEAEMNDWHFDIGIDENSRIVVDAYPSGKMVDKRFIGLSREVLVDLRKKINEALRNFPKEGKS